MPSEYGPRRAKRDEHGIDGLTFVAFLGALMMLMAMLISYVDKEIESQQAAVRAYLDTGVSPPRI